MGRGSTR